jgi:hypothetical protein
MAVRIVAYAMLGAILATIVLVGVNLYIFRAAGIDLSGTRLDTLLLEVMGLPVYLPLGVVTGALLAPFPARDAHPVARLLIWTGFGALFGLVTPVFRLIFDLGGIPTVSELTTRLSVDPKAIIVGATVGLVLSWIEMGAQACCKARDRRRQAAAAAAAGQGSDVDATLKSFWRERAEAYLANRERH